jgi:hypothetical protein
VQLLRREFANVIARGVGMYYMDQSGTFFADARLISELGRLKKWGGYSIKLPRRSVAQVAVFSAPQSEFYIAGRETKRNHITQALNDAQIGELCRCGTPFDWYHIDDLEEGLVRPYRICIFLDCFCLTPSQTAAVEKLKADDRTLLWFYAPGFVAPDGLSLARMHALTGLEFEQVQEGTLQVFLEKGTFANSPDCFGFPVSQSPVFVPTDVQARVWGRSALGRPAFVQRKHDRWRSVYCLAPVVPAAVLREVFRAAGVHIYCDTVDNLSANASWVSLHAAAGGRKTIRLPKPSPVYDTVGEKLLLDNGTEFTVDLKAGETGIWMLAQPDR